MTDRACMTGQLSTGPPPGDPAKNKQENISHGPPNFKIWHPKQLIKPSRIDRDDSTTRIFAVVCQITALVSKTTTFLSRFLAGMIVAKKG